MSDPYIGEIRMFAGNFAPVGWEFCNGQQLPISEFDALYALIGTRYGGDGVNYFNLPNLQSRIPVHMGPAPTYALAATGGVESVVLGNAQMPVHRHALAASSSAGTATSPSGNVWAPNSETPYSTVTAGAVPMSPAALPAAGGGGQAHDNMPPFLALNFIIALYGIYPSPA